MTAEEEEEEEAEGGGKEKGIVEHKVEDGEEDHIKRYKRTMAFKF